MNILFLDFDGVLNSKQHFLALDKLEGKGSTYEADLEYMKAYTNPNNMWVLKYILEQVPDLKIVLSTSWRNHFGMEQFKELFKHYGLDGERIIDKTPQKLSSTRANEIHMWLQEHTYETHTWIALDDHAIWELDEVFKAAEILTDPWVGLTMNDAYKIIVKFKPDFKLPTIHI